MRTTEIRGETIELGLSIPDAVATDLCENPDECPIAMCGCRFLQTGEPWKAEQQEGGE